MKRKRKAVFLVINYMPHQVVSIQTLIDNYQFEIHSFSYKDNTEQPVNTDNLITYRSKDFKGNKLIDKILGIKPEIMIVAGWAVSDFVWAAKYVRKKLKIPVVTYSDTQWKGTWRQRLNCLISPWHIKKAFSHIWIAGVFQFEYARKLGFLKSKIIYNSLSCDVKLFGKASIEQKITTYPKNFLFIGRFVSEKGLDLLLRAWRNIPEKNGWKLTLIGDGPLKEKYIQFTEVTIKEFMPQEKLILEIEKSGCFILPSIFEQWSLVIHEAATAGLPIIATNVCGASPHFIINGYNGYQVEPNVESLQSAIQNILFMDDDKLIQFSENSRRLAASITPSFGAAQLMGILN